MSEGQENVVSVKCTAWLLTAAAGNPPTAAGNADQSDGHPTAKCERECPRSYDNGTAGSRKAQAAILASSTSCQAQRVRQRHPLHIESAS